uniref:ORF42d n=1 Tax=Pinus thunbergii TaxID=3350 RepID=Q32982_PINTH|nr:ORF42d [Pinus thunbergii]
MYRMVITPVRNGSKLRCEKRKQKGKKRVSLLDHNGSIYNFLL